MRFLINYIRQCFCRHDFERSEYEYSDVERDINGLTKSKRDGIKVSLICKKCSYYSSFWKF